LAVANGVKYARGEVAKRTGEILSAYRTYCAKSPGLFFVFLCFFLKKKKKKKNFVFQAPGQLILPEALKHLPAYVLGLLKSPLLRPSSTSISPQQRCFFLRCVLPYSLVGHVLPICYPVALPLHQIDLNSFVPEASSGLGGNKTA
jgi:hypothetical protein